MAEVLKERFGNPERSFKISEKEDLVPIWSPSCPYLVPILSLLSGDGV